MIHAKPAPDVAPNQFDVHVEIHLRDRTIYTFTGIGGDSLATINTLHAAWQAGRTGGVNLNVMDATGAHFVQFGYQDIVRIVIEKH